MALISEQILKETDSELTIKFTSRSGRELTKTVNKVPELTTEQLMRRWHTRMTREYMSRPFKFKRADNVIDV